MNNKYKRELHVHGEGRPFNTIFLYVHIHTILGRIDSISSIVIYTFYLLLHMASSDFKAILTNFGFFCHESTLDLSLSVCLFVWYFNKESSMAFDHQFNHQSTLIISSTISYPFCNFLTCFLSS